MALGPACESGRCPSSAPERGRHSAFSSRALPPAPWQGATTAHTSRTTPLAGSAPGLAGTVPQLSPFRQASTVPHDEHSTRSFSPPLPTHLSMTSGNTLLRPHQQQQHPPPAGSRNVLASLDSSPLHVAATPGVLEFSREKQLVPTDTFPDHGYAWVTAAESHAAHAAESDLTSRGYRTSFHPADSPAAFAAVRRDVCEADISGRPPVAFLHAGEAAHGSAAPPSWSAASASQLGPGAPVPTVFPHQHLPHAAPVHHGDAPFHGTGHSLSGHSHAEWSRAPHHGGSEVHGTPAPTPPPRDQVGAHPNDHSSVAGTFQPGGWPNTAPPPVPPVVHVGAQGQGGSGASTPPSGASTTVSSGTSTGLPSASGLPLASIAEGTGAGGITASDVARLVTEAVAAANTAPTRVPSSFKLPPFDGTDGKWVAFSRSLSQSLEMDCFAPGSDDLVTTPSNRVQSSQLRTALYAALSKAAAARFDDRDDLRGKGFEMVAILREAYAPTGEDAIFPNFRSLFSLEQGSKEELSTYMARIRTIKGKLKAGGIDLPPILLNMFTVKGLGGAYSAIKREFALKSGLFSSLDLEGIELKCANFTSALTAMGDDEEDTYASAAAAPAGPHKPADRAAGGARPVFPPAKPPPGHKVTALMSKAATECSLCHQKHNGLAKCG